MLTLTEELIWGSDCFYIGCDASAELEVRIRPVTADLQLTIFTPDNPYYILEKHSWMFFHTRGDLMRYPHAKDTMTAKTYLFFGRYQWLHHEKLFESYYWIDLLGLLPVGLAAALGAICCRRRQKRSPSA